MLARTCTMPSLNIHNRQPLCRAQQKGFTGNFHLGPVGLTAESPGWNFPIVNNAYNVSAFTLRHYHLTSLFESYTLFGHDGGHSDSANALQSENQRSPLTDYERKKRDGMSVIQEEKVATAYISQWEGGFVCAIEHRGSQWSCTVTGCSFAANAQKLKHNWKQIHYRSSWTSRMHRKIFSDTFLFSAGAANNTYHEKRKAK